MLYFSDMSMPGEWNQDQQDQIRQAEAAIEAGGVRFEIPCEEARNSWFDMAYRMYVGDNPQPNIPGDIELGFHLNSCITPECMLLDRAYWEILRPSQPSESEVLASALEVLRAYIGKTNN